MNTRFHRQYRVWILALSIVFLFQYCRNDDGGSPSSDSITDEYYVKYELESRTSYPSPRQMDVTITNEKGNSIVFTIDQGNKFEKIIGPVGKDFNASLSAKAENFSQTRVRLYATISASKNDGPFAFKTADGSDDPRDEVSIQYKIDF